MSRIYGPKHPGGLGGIEEVGAIGKAQIHPRPLDVMLEQLGSLGERLHSKADQISGINDRLAGPLAPTNEQSDGVKKENDRGGMLDQLHAAISNLENANHRLTLEIERLNGIV